MSFAGLRRVVGVGLFAAASLSAHAAGAEDIKIGQIAIGSTPAQFVAQEKGYFAAEGVPAEMVYFDAAQPVAVAVVSGSIDVGVAALTAGLYNLAAQGGLRIIAASAREHPGFHLQAYVISNHAASGGLTSLKDLPGHSFGATGMGAPTIYVIGSLVSEKYGFDFKAIRVVPMSTISNIFSALAGGQVDFTLTSLTATGVPLLEHGDMKLLGWAGDTTPWQYGAVFVSTKTADERGDMIQRFLHAYRKGVREYHDAFTGPGETRADGPNAPEMEAILAKYLHQTPAEAASSISYLDPEARLDVADVLRQVAFYRSQGLVKGPHEAAEFVDKRYVVPLPEH